MSGSTTGSLGNIYIVSLSYPHVSPPAPAPEDNGTLSGAFSAPSDATSLRETRVGYLGLCARTSFDVWICDTRPPSLVQALRDANQTDHLNLIWAANQFRTEAVTSIFLYVFRFDLCDHLSDMTICRFITFAAAFLNLIVGILYPTSISDVFKVSWLERLCRFLRQPPYFLGPTFLSGFMSTLVIFAAFTAALWQHMSGAIYTSMAGVLAFDAVVCRTGPEAVAIAWVIFALATCGAITLIIEGRWRPSALMSQESLAHSSSSGTGTVNAEEDAEANIDMAEQPPQPAWHQPQVLPNLAWLLYLTGQGGDPEMTVRQRNTATWVHRDDRMHPGHAETVIEEA